MNDRYRVSDADRDRVTAQLRDHYAEGRLSTGELDERLTAALNAKTAGELRRVLADLPGPGPDRGTLFPPRSRVFPPGAGVFPPEPGVLGPEPGMSGPGAGRFPGAGMFPGVGMSPRAGGPVWVRRRRGPRVLPLIALALVLTLLIPGAGSVVVTILQAVLLLWLVACLAGIFMAARFYRRVRRDWRSSQIQDRIQHWADGYTRP
jgi:Domain of unknown function (DUF1707)